MNTTEKKDKKDIYKYQNDYNREHYERIAVTYPKGTKERIKATGQSLNNFIKAATLAALDQIEKEG